MSDRRRDARRGVERDGVEGGAERRPVGDHRRRRWPPSPASGRRSAWPSAAPARVRLPRPGTARPGRSPRPAPPVPPRHPELGLVCRQPTCARCSAPRSRRSGSIFGNQWNGTALSLTTAATPAVAGHRRPIRGLGHELRSATWCLAVGANDIQITSTASAFSEMWNGTNWTLVTTPAPRTATGSLLRGISAPARTFSPRSVRPTFAGPLNQNLIETWNGTSWAVTPSPDTSAYVESGADRRVLLQRHDVQRRRPGQRRLGTLAGHPGPVVERHRLDDVPNTPNDGTAQT